MALNIASSAAPLLRPVVGLAGWTFVMEIWMYSTRLPAIRKYGVSGSPYTTKEEMHSKIPRPIQWIADNYNHLHEQPTVFYAVTLALAVLGDTHPISTRAAWGYVGIRAAHSILQATANTILVRFGLFLTSSIVLAGLTGRLASLVF